MNKKLKIGIIVIILIAFSPVIGIYSYKYALHLRHKMQERFAEIHAALSDGEDDPSLTQAQIDARDNVVTPIATTQNEIKWEILAKADTKMTSDNVVRPVFNKDIAKLDKQTLIAKGYMVPLDSFSKQTHFLLSPYPPSCPFCLPAGPNELIEIKPTDAMKFTYDPITVKGKFELLQSDDEIKQGMFYRMKMQSCKIKI